MATQHTYLGGTFAGIPLNIIITAASNIQLVNFRNSGSKKSLRNSSYYGINGAWYNRDSNVRTDQILNIAMYNGSALGPDTNRDGLPEGSNNYVGSGVVAWNGSQLSCYTSVEAASEISFLKRAGTWGQGGIALWLGWSNWLAQVEAQPSGSLYTGSADGRTALIANMSTNKVYLIVTTATATTATFRAAIQSYLGITDGAQANNTYQGIMLDGGSSTQLKAKTSNNTTVNIGNSSAIPEVIVLKSSS